MLESGSKMKCRIEKWHVIYYSLIWQHLYFYTITSVHSQKKKKLLTCSTWIFQRRHRSFNLHPWSPPHSISRKPGKPVKPTFFGFLGFPDGFLGFPESRGCGGHRSPFGHFKIRKWKGEEFLFLGSVQMLICANIMAD